jgi:hypothetical protein
LVTLTAATTTSISGIFANSHVAATPVFAVGAFLNGIRTPATATNTYGTAAAGYYSDRLDVYGDLHGNGTITEVVYYCDPVKNQLTRQEVVYPNTASTYTPVILITSVVSCTSTSTSGVFGYAPSPGNGVYPSVSMTLTAQSAIKSLETNQYVTLTKSLLNIQPRNMMTEYLRVTGGSTTESQPDPMASTYPNGELQPLLGQ